MIVIIIFSLLSFHMQTYTIYISIYIHVRIFIELETEMDLVPGFVRLTGFFDSLSLLQKNDS